MLKSEEVSGKCDYALLISRAVMEKKVLKVKTNCILYWKFYEEKKISESKSQDENHQNCKIIPWKMLMFKNGRKSPNTKKVRERAG